MPAPSAENHLHYLLQKLCARRGAAVEISLAVKRRPHAVRIWAKGGPIPLEPRALLLKLLPAMVKQEKLINRRHGYLLRTLVAKTKERGQLKAIADRLGVSPTLVSRWALRKVAIDPRHFDALEEILLNRFGDHAVRQRLYLQLVDLSEHWIKLNTRELLREMQVLFPGIKKASREECIRYLTLHHVSKMNT